MNKIAVVGGGTAGLVSALILKRKFSNLKIDVIRSEKIGIIGVGEGSTEHWKEFMNFVGISDQQLIQHTDATPKLGIMFEDWNKRPYFQSIQKEYDIKMGQYHSGYGYFIKDNVPPLRLGQKYYVENNLPKAEVRNFLLQNTSPANQYHFNTVKLNEFLSQLCLERGINIINDEVKDVVINEEGIDKLIGERYEHNYDFYVDSTGFQKLLISKLGAKWQSYSQYLKMNEAIAFQTKDTDNYNSWTLAKAMSAGWMWRIPVWERWGNGYVFDNNYINAEQAKKEVEDYLGYEITIGKNVTFNPGCLDNVWIKNCVAIGLSANFVEPLEASSIGTSIQQAFLLVHYLPNYKKTKGIEIYNKKINHIMHNIRDFIILHYLNEKNDTPFWSELDRTNIPDSLKEKLEVWKHRLPISEDFENSNYYLFTAAHHLLVLYGNNHFDVGSIRQEYDMMSDEMKNITTNTITNTQAYDYMPTITNKEYIRMVRELKI